MRIVHINTFDGQGGAARAAYRLHDGLRRSGQESRMFVLRKSSADPFVTSYILPRDILSRIKRHLRQETILRAINRYRATAPDGLSFFTYDRTSYGKDPWQQLPENDLIQLHWISGFVDYQAFFSALPAGKPLVWTMHGMDAITGGCHYDRGCGKFVQECGACPQLGSQSASDLTNQVWRRKQESFQSVGLTQLHIITPSRWLRDEVKRSSLMSRFPCSVIPYGLDTEVFTPRDRRAAREVVGVPPEARVILFIADGLNDPRKGFQFLVEALKGMRPGFNAFLLSLGPGCPPNLQGIPHVHIDSASNDRFLSYVYSAADVFVAPSLQDNLPNTLLEAIACGTPVVGFEVGGIPDVVRPGVTGMLAKLADAQDLRQVISEMLSDSSRLLQMSANCRKVATEEYKLEIQAKRYVELYSEVLGRPVGAL